MTIEGGTEDSSDKCGVCGKKLQGVTWTGYGRKEYVCWRCARALFADAADQDIVRQEAVEGEA